MGLNEFYGFPSSFPSCLPYEKPITFQTLSLYSADRAAFIFPFSRPITLVLGLFAERAVYYGYSTPSLQLTADRDVSVEWMGCDVDVLARGAGGLNTTSKPTDTSIEYISGILQVLLPFTCQPTREDLVTDRAAEPIKFIPRFKERKNLTVVLLFLRRWFATPHQIK